MYMTALEGRLVLRVILSYVSNFVNMGFFEKTTTWDLIKHSACKPEEAHHELLEFVTRHESTDEWIDVRDDGEKWTYSEMYGVTIESFDRYESLREKWTISECGRYVIDTRKTERMQQQLNKTKELEICKDSLKTLIAKANASCDNCIWTLEVIERTLYNGKDIPMIS